MNEPAPVEKQPELTPFEKMAALASRVLSVPKTEVDRREQEWKEQRKTSARQGPKAQN